MGQCIFLIQKILLGVTSPSGFRFRFQNAGFSVQCSVFNVQCSVFSVQCSMFSVQCSGFKVLEVHWVIDHLAWIQGLRG